MKKAPIVEIEDDNLNNMDDAYEDYFENQMMQDVMGIEEYEQQIDYFEELKKVEDRVAQMGPETEENPKSPTDTDGLDDDYLMENIMISEEISSPTV